MIYREEVPKEVTLIIKISPKKYGKGYEFLTKMGYPGHGPLSDRKHALVEPLSHTNRCKSKETP